MAGMAEEGNKGERDLVRFIKLLLVTKSNYGLGCKNRF